MWFVFREWGDGETASCGRLGRLSWVSIGAGVVIGCCCRAAAAGGDGVRAGCDWRCCLLWPCSCVARLQTTKTTTSQQTNRRPTHTYIHIWEVPGKVRQHPPHFRTYVYSTRVLLRVWYPCGTYFRIYIHAHTHTLVRTGIPVSAIPALTRAHGS